MSSEDNLKSIFDITWRDFQFSYPSNHAEVNVINVKTSGLHKIFKNIFVVNLLNIFLLLLTFPSIIAVEFYFYEDARLI